MMDLRPYSHSHNNLSELQANPNFDLKICKSLEMSESGHFWPFLWDWDVLFGKFHSRKARRKSQFKYSSTAV